MFPMLTPCVTAFLLVIFGVAVLLLRSALSVDGTLRS